MATFNPFVNFLPFAVEGTLYSTLARMLGTHAGIGTPIWKLRSVQPTGSMWRTIGFTSPTATEELAWRIDGKPIIVLCVRTCDRVLPGRVIRNAVNKRRLELEELQSRKMTRKEIAEIRDDAEAVLLPKAFVRPSEVYVMLSPQRLFVYTASAKRAREAAYLVATLATAVGVEDHKFRMIRTQRPIDDLLTEIARDGKSFVSRDSGVWFEGATQGTFTRHEDTRDTIVVKGEHIPFAYETKLEGYKAVGLQVWVYDEQHPQYDNRLATASLVGPPLIVRGCRTPASSGLELRNQGLADRLNDFAAHIIISYDLHATLVRTVLDLCEGFWQAPNPEDSKTGEASYLHEAGINGSEEPEPGTDDAEATATAEPATSPGPYDDL